jgi:hypothetical protein
LKFNKLRAIEGIAVIGLFSLPRFGLIFNGKRANDSYPIAGSRITPIVSKKVLIDSTIDGLVKSPFHSSIPQGERMR